MGADPGLPDCNAGEKKNLKSFVQGGALPFLRLPGDCRGLQAQTGRCVRLLLLSCWLTLGCNDSHKL